MQTTELLLPILLKTFGALSAFMTSIIVFFLTRVMKKIDETYGAVVVVQNQSTILKIDVNSIKNSIKKIESTQAHQDERLRKVEQDVAVLYRKKTDFRP